ncbi:hypothetical protein [Marinobacter sp. BSs20148]|uniref:hypothetical protein n=1 Tax=Marinobacter sp. BSs20148 TaxID=490759 RepID=UPI00269C4E4F|nr:hypothetical protein [Marinobacter sp. BSs20148]
MPAADQRLLTLYQIPQAIGFLLIGSCTDNVCDAARKPGQIYFRGFSDGLELI